MSHLLRWKDPYEDYHIDGSPTGRWMTDSEGELQIEIKYTRNVFISPHYTPGFWGKLFFRKPKPEVTKEKTYTKWCHWTNLSIIHEPIINHCGGKS